MVDPLKERLDKIRKFSDSAKRRANLYSEVNGIHNEHASSSLGALQKAPAPGKKLQKIGFLMLWIPEPTGVTCAIGGPMIVAGRYLDKKYNGSTLHDIGHETKSTISSLSDFKNSIM
ncbi:hypothetical protein BD31_I0092 [Candidatus Nitrosopumilus salaria BD31]|uniref:Uncharacterized protein n=1 Tax=Candidatus Nitrosopumilus salarius BD31 TaxID=859350 RepID=I3D2R3_9ARCH|nr:hypothetical protein [Candidatus Nitrosopumilus salaria]EIJ66006.1 hypothetical protein BD31_I0092 [Candidatus Nitrosopumilus salaria BD31]